MLAIVAQFPEERVKDEDATQALNLYKTPCSAEYGGFSGGLTAIEIGTME